MRLFWGGWKMQLYAGLSEKAHALSKVPLFEGLRPRELMEIARRVDQITVPPGETLVKQGQQSRQAVVIVKGAVSVIRDGEVMKTFGPGETMGIGLGADPHPATCVAADECVLLVMSVNELNTLLDTVPALHRRIMVNLSRRFSNVENQPDDARQARESAAARIDPPERHPPI